MNPDTPYLADEVCRGSKGLFFARLVSQKKLKASI